MPTTILQAKTDDQFKELLKNKYANYVVVGITGHRDLLFDDKKRIKEEIEKKLKELANGKPILLVSSLAMRSDQWAAQCIKGITDSVLCVPLTMEPDDYADSGFLKEKITDKKTGQTTRIYHELEKDYFKVALAKPETIQVKLYDDSLYAGRTRLTDRARDRQYEELGKFMTRHCDHLIALWDGVDGGGVGGTSDVVRMMVQGKSLLGGRIEQKKTPQQLHQYVVPREKNLFPIGRRFAKGQMNWPTGAPYSWVDSPLQNQHKSFWQRFWKGVVSLPFWYRLIGVFILVLSIIDIIKTYPDHFGEDVLVWVMLLGLYWLAGWTYAGLNRSRGLLLQFIYPLVMALMVLLSGTIGFYLAKEKINSVDSFFSAANLITLNASVFPENSENSTSVSPFRPNPWLKTARILGGFLAGYAFILAFALAAGRENVGRFLFFLYRFLRYIRKLLTGIRFLWPTTTSPQQKLGYWQRLGTFGVVMGGDTTAVNVAIDASKNAYQRVILLASEVDDNTLSLLNANRVWVFQGKITSRTALQKTFFWKANAVYVVSDSDEDNFRCAQELDELYVSKSQPGFVRTGLLADRNQWLFRRLPDRWQEVVRKMEKANWHVHQQDGRQRALLQRISRQFLRTFSVSENTARRLLLRYPIDRFVDGESTVAEVAILGFGPLGQDIALACLRLGHYTPGKHLHLTVYYRPDEKTAVDTFRNVHPELIKNQEKTGLFSQNSYEQRVQQYTFFTRKKPAPDSLSPADLCNWLTDRDLPVIEFRPLPIAESGIISPTFPLYEAIQPGRVVSIYVCQPTGLESASLLNSILPRIEWLKLGRPDGHKQIDVQVFCAYNFPDPDEEQYVEMKLNSITSYVPIVCFGNYLHECSVDAIQNESLNRIAKQIALLYACLYGDKEILDEIPDLQALLQGMNFDEEAAWKIRKDGTERTYNEINIEKTKALLPELLAMKNHPQQSKEFYDWLDTCWQNLKEIDRESNSQAADHAWVKLRLLGQPWNTVSVAEVIFEEKLVQLSEVEHRRWNAEKLLLGWLPEPDKGLWNEHKKNLREHKLHHFLMTFDQLPPNQKNKDHTQVLGIPYFFQGLTDRPPES